MTIWLPVLDRSKPLYLAIADAIMKDVDSGALTEGARLPPQRDLAWKLGVTLGTVTRGYKEAEGRGLLEGEVGRGSFVRHRGFVAPITPARLDGENIIDLTHAVPPPVVTQAELDAALNFVMHEPQRLSLLDYSPPEGHMAHRELGAKWLRLSGIEAEPADVFVTAGAHLGLLTVLAAIAEPREAVMAETVNYALLGATLKNAYLEALPIQMDREGLLPDAFERAAKGGQSRILYLVPTLQNPTTSTLTRARREKIVSIARQYNITIIEDDIFRLLDGRTQPATLYSLAPERTFHITSLSKTLAPGLRMGFVVAPKGQDRLLKAHIRTGAARSIGITAEMARYWIENGTADILLTRVRNELAARRAVALEIFRGYTCRCEQGAPYAWLELPPHWTAGRFTTVLAARGVKATPGSAFDLEQAHSGRKVRIGLGQPANISRLRAALEVIRNLMSDHDDDDFTPVA
jgi:DNA-binding transcriptional MocR family regulator